MVSKLTSLIFSGSQYTDKQLEKTIKSWLGEKEMTAIAHPKVFKVFY